MKVLLTVLFICLLYTNVNNINQNIPKTYNIVNITETILNQTNLYKELINNKIEHPEIVLKQAILETGWLKSYNCRKRNNLFGFTLSKGYLTFANWKECVSYYKRWQTRHYKQGDYYTFLCKIGYAEDPDYIIKLKNIKIDKQI